jgi:hypothetical protein
MPVLYAKKNKCIHTKVLINITKCEPSAREKNITYGIKECISNILYF